MKDRERIDTPFEDIAADSDAIKNSWIYTVVGLVLFGAALWIYSITEASTLFGMGLLLVMLFAGVACLYTGYGLRKDARRARRNERAH